ncbi:hypothetical protein BKA81DRAFT_397548 [Phyllosticta paracitricarpa]
MGMFTFLSPLSIGHESARLVVGIGEQGEGFRLGDLVAIGVEFRITFPLNRWLSWSRWPWPSTEQGDTAIIFGAGTVGLLTAAMAKLTGATTVVIADINVGRVKFALDHGFATSGYVVTNSSSTAKEDRIHAAARQLANDVVAIACADELNAEGGEVTFECTGKEVYMQVGLYATRPGGKLIMVGMGTPVRTLQMSAAQWKKVDILGVFRYANRYPVGLKIDSSGLLPNLDAMITHRVQGSQAARDAFELAARAADDDGNLVLKVLMEN